MYHVKTLIVVLVTLILITHPDLHGIVYGSNTATTIQQFVTYPQTDTTNTMLGFGRFSNGFGLASANTTCTFNDFFPVDTSMDLDGGTLILLEDLLLDSQLVVGSLGTILGNRHCVSFAAQTQPILLPSLGTLNQLSTQNAGAPVNSTEWSGDNKYLAVGTNVQGSPGTEVKIYSLSATGTLSLAAGVHLGNSINLVAWRPGTSSYYLAAATSGPAGGAYVYHFTPPNSLVATSTVGTGTFFLGVTWHPSGNALAVGKFAATSQQILMYDFDPITGTLTYHTSYSFPSPMDFQARALDFDYSGSYLAAGLQYYNQLQVLHWDGTSLLQTASLAVATIGAVKWSPDGSLIAIGSNNATLQIFSFNRTTQTLALLPSYNFALAAINSINWSPDGNTLAVGVQTLNNGIALFAVNRMTQLLVCLGQYYTAGYTESASWSPNGNYLATGNYSTSYASVYNFLPGIMTFSNANIVFNSPVQLQGSFVCSGNCIINGNGDILNLNSQLLTVTANSSLLFKDITLEGITGTNLQCLDSSGTISFDNVTCMINNSMQLNQGKFAITGQCVMTGTGTFIYSSNQASTISSHAQWYFDRGITFSYYPQGGSTGLINFADSSAQLYLYATNLYAASTGLHLTKGCLMIDGPCQFLSDSASEVNGIWIGDGIAADDLKVKILEESGIIVGKGYVSYRNTK